MTAVKEAKQMTVQQIPVQRISVVSSNPFESVLSKLQAVLGHPDMAAFAKDVAATKDYAELERVIGKMVGTSGLMEFTRFNMGEILSKEQGAGSPRIVRLVVGNPLIMKQMAQHVHDAASYAPATILIDERPDGVHISYDRMASYLAPYGSAQALKVAKDLDTKIEALLAAVAT
jgi:hypothetical protein